MDYLPFIGLMITAGLIIFGAGPVTAEINEACMKLTECSSEANAALQNNQLEEMCNLTKKAVACFDRYIEKCTLKAVVEGFKKTSKTLMETHEKRCGKKENKGRNETSPSAVLNYLLLIVCLVLGQLGLNRHTSG